MIKKIIRLIVIIVASITTFIFVYLFLALILSRCEVPAEKVKGNDIAIFILSNGVHTDFVLPVKTKLNDWSDEMKFADDTTFRYVGIGWGDKRFYLETPTWADLSFKTAFNATFGLGSSAIHTTFYKEMKESYDCIKINLTIEQYGRLIKYIDSSFKKNLKGHYILIVTNANYGESDAFYDAKNRFSLFNTCNTWLNSGLKACGQKACLWTPFDKGIFYQYKKDNFGSK